ncbi:hypothetical protein M2133_000958 [Parabacteroides sp. PF5-6]|nr:hypothetical protein [Parabacteroides sp. PF5-6]
MLPNITLGIRLHQPVSTKGILLYYPLSPISSREYADKYEVIVAQKEDKKYILLMPKRYMQTAKSALMLCN